MWRDLYFFCAREFGVYLRRLSTFSHYLLFFCVVVFLFIFAMGSELAGENEVVVAVIWAAFILSVIIFVPNLYGTDYSDGSLEQVFLIGRGFASFILSKLLFLWAFSVVPIVVLAPLILYALGNVDQLYMERLLVGMLLGSPVVVLLSSVMASITLAMNRNVELIGILMFPLLLPVLIFSILWTLSGEAWVLQILVSLLIFTLPVTVWGTFCGLTHAIRNN
jgi:heme exporter protein B